MNRFLNIVEFLGNKLPHPFLLFIFLAIFVVLSSALLNAFGVSTIDPQSGDMVFIKSLLDADGVAFLFSSVIKNYINFPPLGLVLVIMMGVGLADKVGLIEACIRESVLVCPKSLLTFGIFIAGMTFAVASDASYFIIIPLAAMVFYSFNRHPVAGAAAGYAATGATKDISFLLTGSDALYAGLSTKAASIIDKDFVVTAVDNYYFAVISCVVLSIAGTIIIDYFIEPRLQKVLPISAYTDSTLQKLSVTEKKALKRTFFAFIALTVLSSLMLYPSSSPLRNELGGLIPSPFLSHIATFIFLYFMTLGIVYGVSVGRITQFKDIPFLIAQSLKDLTPILVLFFAISQFLAYFGYSNLAKFIAIEGAIFLKESGFTGYDFMISFIVMTALLNIFMTSGSAQYSLMAPIFVPMLMYINYHPAFSLAMYKIGDSVTNIISPCSPYFSVALLFMQQYCKNMGIGTLIATMLPISLFFLIVWTCVLLAFVAFDIPFGPGVGVFLS